jgi:16S rRNA processing protein RimM
VKCDVTRAARSLFTVGATFQCATAGQETDVRLHSVREHRGRLLLAFDGVEGVAAQTLVGATLYVPRDAIPLQPGEYLDDDLVACEVVGKDGRRFGRVERVEHFPASDMLVTGGRMIPMVDAIVKEVDVTGRRVVIDPPAGLLD